MHCQIQVKMKMLHLQKNEQFGHNCARTKLDYVIKWNYVKWQHTLQTAVNQNLSVEIIIRMLWLDSRLYFLYINTGTVQIRIIQLHRTWKYPRLTQSTLTSHALLVARPYSTKCTDFKFVHVFWDKALSSSLAAQSCLLLSNGCQRSVSSCCSFWCQSYGGGYGADERERWLRPVGDVLTAWQPSSFANSWFPPHFSLECAWRRHRLVGVNVNQWKLTPVSQIKKHTGFRWTFQLIWCGSWL